MNNKNNIEEEISRFKALDTDPSITLENKLDELIALLAQSNLDTETVKKYQRRVNEAFEHSSAFNDYLNPFEALEDKNLSREDMLDKMSILLSQNQIDSDLVKKEKPKDKKILQRVMGSLMGVVLVVLGFAMIVMPATPDFEIYTIFHFTEQDGVTIMDLISLLIVFAGVYILIVSLTKYRSAELHER